MKVVHVSPSYFGDASTVGGGERYAQELARTMADSVPTTFISFGARRDHYRLGNLQVEIFPSHPLPWRRDAPFSLAFLRLVVHADVIHCHQLGTPVNVLALLVGRVARKRTFLTPLGLAPTHLEHRLTQLARPTGVLCISAYSGRNVWYRAPRDVIYGGVDTEKFPYGTESRQRKIVCVGRIMPHKGINYLIEALDPDMTLEVYGRPYDTHYYLDLRALATNKNVTFVVDADDEAISRAYREAMVVVLPSVHRDMYGTEIAEPELLGMALLEAMASGAAVIGTNVTSTTEVIQDGVNGRLVPPGDVAALNQALRSILADPPAALAMGARGCERVHRQFTWPAVVDRCLAAYRRTAWDVPAGTP